MTEAPVVLRKKMNEKQLHIRPKPFVLWTIGIFVLCLVPLLALLRSGSLLADKARLTFIVSISVAAVAAVAGAFVMCATVQAIRGFKSGELGIADLVGPGIVAVMIGLLFLGYAFIPKVTGAIELSFWLVCLVVWLVDVGRRLITKRREHRTAGPTGRA